MLRPALLLLLLTWSLPLRAQLVDLPGLPHVPFFSLATRGDTLLAGGASGVHASLDGGHSWHALAHPAPDASSIDALALTDAGWFAGTYGQGVYLSRDAGRTWHPHSSGLSGMGSHHLVALHERAGWLHAATDGSGVFRLRLQPLGTWERYGTIFGEYEAESVQAMALHAGALVVSSGGNGFVFVDAPATGTWTPVPLNTHVLGFASDGDTLVAISSRRCLYSPDGGQSWHPAGPGLLNGLHATLAHGAGRFFAARTTSEGVSQVFAASSPTAAWTPVLTTSETFRLFVHGGRLYLAQMDGLRALALVPVHTTPEPPVAAPVRLDAPAPHPATGPVRLTFSLTRPGPVVLAAYDALGRHVATPFEGNAAAGETTVGWRTEDLPAGVYALRLATRQGTATRLVAVLR